LALEEAKINAQQQNCVESAKGGTDLVDGQHAGVVDAPPTTHLDGEGGDVDGNDLMASLLELEGSPARPTADI